MRPNLVFTKVLNPSDCQDYYKTLFLWSVSCSQPGNILKAQIYFKLSSVYLLRSIPAVYTMPYMWQQTPPSEGETQNTEIDRRGRRGLLVRSQDVRGKTRTLSE